MIALELSAEQQRAVETDFDGCLAIVGTPGTGKTTAFHERLTRARRLHPDTDPLVVDGQHRFDAYAVRMLNDAGIEAHLVDDVEAALLFATACAPLFTLDWEEFPAEQLDPEVPGLRAPERFAESAFRLIRKLREAHIEPDEFLSRALAGATEFYAKPPNLADPKLLYATKDVYRDSLNVTPEELQRQYRREVDLAKILAKLYTSYVELVETSGRMTGRDAVVAAVRHVRANAATASALRTRHRLAFVDRAEDLTIAELRLLQAIFGEELGGVTLCGDPSSAISSLHAGRPDLTFASAGTRIELHEQHRSPLAIERACRQLTNVLDEAPPSRHPERSPEGAEPKGQLQLHRAASVRDEASFIAGRVRNWLDDGVPPDRIAILFRSIRNVEPYEAALLDRDVPVVTSGDANIFADRRALDALALLWNVYDPFRHDWLLRTLANPAFGLSDASLAILCAEPPSPQTPLFVLDDEPAPTVRSSRWDPKRDLRLGWNVVRGEQDDALAPEARARVERFRRLREGWLDAMHTLPFEQFAPIIWRDGVAREGIAGSARARAQQIVLRRLLSRLTAFFTESPDATIADALEYAERRARSDLESCEDADAQGFVRLLSIDASRGREFDRVVVANVRAGAFPRWYAPDAFLYSPRLGMIPKENVGDARASRTAKFTYYLFRTSAREGYNERERRALVYALRRARVSAVVTASETPTKGVAAPELLEELRNARIPGAENV